MTRTASASSTASPAMMPAASQPLCRPDDPAGVNESIGGAVPAGPANR